MPVIDKEDYYNENVRNITLKSKWVGFQLSIVNNHYRCIHPTYGTFDFPFRMNPDAYSQCIEFDQLLDQALIDAKTIVTD